MIKIAVFCLLLVCLLQLATEGDAVCCKTHKFKHLKDGKTAKVCDDCTKGTPYCSLYGSCNVFGCNCDGGCRYGECAGAEEKAPIGGGGGYGGGYGGGNSGYGGGYGDEEVQTPPKTNNGYGKRETAEDVIASADVDGDGRMSLEEARLYLGVSSDRVRRSFADLDRDYDDFLSVDEIDPTE